jgi:hypothetical protein
MIPMLIMMMDYIRFIYHHHFILKHSCYVIQQGTLLYDFNISHGSHNVLRECANVYSAIPCDDADHCLLCSVSLCYTRAAVKLHHRLQHRILNANKAAADMTLINTPSSSSDTTTVMNSSNISPPPPTTTVVPSPSITKA